MKLQKYGMTADWTKVYNHDLSKTSEYWGGGGTTGVEVMTDVGTSPSDGKYSRLSYINDYRGSINSDLHLKLVYPNEGWEIEWTQQSDINIPYQEGAVEDLNIISYTPNKDISEFVGLRQSSNPYTSYIDACEGTSWWFSIATASDYNGGIPGWPTTVTQHVELYVKMPPEDLLTTSGVASVITLSPSIDTSGTITYNGFEFQSLNAGFFVLIGDTSGGVSNQGNFSSADSLATEINNSVIGQNKLFFIITVGGCSSSDSLDNVMNNLLHCNHWKTKDIYSNSREPMHYAGIIHGQYGAIKELLTVNEPEILYYQGDSVQAMMSAGYGKYVLIAPDDNNDSFSGIPRTSNIIASATALLTSNTTGNINIIFKQDNTVLATETLTVSSFTNMYSDVEKYLAVPANTNNITYTKDSNIELVGLCIRWSGNVTDDVITDAKFGKNGISNKKIVQNNIPVSFLDKVAYDNFYKNNNLIINPTQSDGTVSVLTASQNQTFDITSALQQYVTGSIIAGFESLVLYFCCWVKGEVNIQLESSDNVFYNPIDFSFTSNNTTIATSDDTGNWELIEGFIFPEHLTEELCTEYLKYFKENCFSNVSCSQTVISQTPGNFYFGGKVSSNTQNITISIEAISESSVYSPVLCVSNSIGLAKDGTVSVVNL